eukprot:3825880-Amphidinium_carterae.1
MPEITIEHLRQSLKKYPRGKACGVDGLSLRALAVLEDPWLRRLTQLLQSWENHGRPLQTFPMVIVFLSKPTGGVRPVSLMPFFLRAWTSVRLTVLNAWAREHQLDGLWGRKGRPAELASWVYQIRLESAAWRRQASAAVFLDLRKFFEYIRHRHVLESGLATSAPIRLLSLACRSYCSCRVISFGSMISSPFQYNASVVPGCKLANGLVMCLTLPLLMELQTHYTSLHTVALLDDWSMHVVGSDAEVVTTLEHATSRAVQWFADRALPLADGKCKILSNRRAVQARLTTALAPLGFVSEPAVRHLGGE